MGSRPFFKAMPGKLLLEREKSVGDAAGKKAMKTNRGLGGNPEFNVLLEVQV